MGKTEILAKNEMMYLARPFLFSRDGKRRKAWQTAAISMTALSSAMLISLSFAYSLCVSMPSLSMKEENQGLFLSIVSIEAFLLASFISSLSMYSRLYREKDIDFLFSLPVSASSIVVAKSSGVLAQSAIILLLLMLPQYIRSAFFMGNLGCIAVFIPFFSALLLLVMSLSLFIAFALFRISAKARNRNLAITILSSAVIIAMLCFSMFPAYGLIEEEAGRSSFVRTLSIISSESIPLSLAAMVLSALLAAAASHLAAGSYPCISFPEDRRGKRPSSWARMRSMQGALLVREARHFLATPVYLINSSVGILMLAVLIIVFAVDRQRLSSLPLPMDRVVYLAIIAASSVNTVSSPSLSLEGKGWDIMKSLPVEGRAILKAKIDLHIAATLPFSLLVLLVFSALLGIPYHIAVLMACSVSSAVVLSASVGLMMDILFPILEWKSEAEPVKRNPALLCSMLISVLLASLTSSFYMVSGSMISLLFQAAILILIAIPVNCWVYNKGAARLYWLSVR